MLTTAVAASQSELYPLWKKADSTYAVGHYAEAQILYDSIIEQGYASAALYYNLGNTFFKQNQLGRAILNYKRALRLQPRNADYLHNLRFAQGKAIDVIDSPVESPFERLQHVFFSSLRMTTWSSFSLSFSMLTLLFFSFYYLSYTPSLKRIFFAFFLLFMGATALTYSGACYQRDKGKDRRRAYVVVPNVMVKNAPASGGGDAFMLHDGSPLTLVKRMNNWYRIRLSDGKVGWIPYGAIEKL